MTETPAPELPNIPKIELPAIQVPEVKAPELPSLAETLKKWLTPSEPEKAAPIALPAPAYPMPTDEELARMNKIYSDKSPTNEQRQHPKPKKPAQAPARERAPGEKAPGEKAPKPAGPEPKLEVVVGIPNAGLLDRYHRADQFTSRPVEGSLYALRTSMVQDLLKTRVEIKKLMGGTRYSRGDFRVPQNVKYLYSGLSAEKGMPVFPEIEKSIDWVETGEPNYSRFDAGYVGFRKAVLLALSLMSVNITQLDMYIRYLKEDWWKDPAIQAKVEAFMKAGANDAAIMKQVAPSNPYSFAITDNFKMLRYAMLRRRVRSDLMRAFRQMYHIDEDIAVFEGLKQGLLTQMPMLAVDPDSAEDDRASDGRPFYKQIYKALEDSIPELPKAEALQPARVKDLPLSLGEGKYEHIVLPDEFHLRAFQALDGIRSGRLLHGFDLANRLTGPRLDRLLLARLEANTRQLEDLTHEFHLHSGVTHLPDLAVHDTYWSTMTGRFGYLSQIGLIDFEAGRKQILAKLSAEELQAARTRVAAEWITGGLGAIAILVGTLGSMGLLPIAAGTAKILALTFGLSASGLWLAESREEKAQSDMRARIARDMFIASAGGISAEEMQTAVKVSRQEYMMYLFAMCAFLGESAYAARLAYGAAHVVTMADGTETIALTRREISELSNQVGDFAPNAARILPQIRPFLVQLERTFGFGSRTRQLVPLKQLISEIASETGMSEAQVTERLGTLDIALGTYTRTGGRTFPMTLSYVIRHNPRLIRVDAGVASEFKRIFWNDQATNMMFTLAVEAIGRGKEALGDQREEFMIDLVSTAVMSGLIVYVLSKPTIQLGLRGLRRPPTSFSRSEGPRYTFAERSVTLLDKSVPFCIVGGLSTGATWGALEAAQQRRDPQDDETSDRWKRTLKMTAFGCVYVAGFSNVRYNALKALNDEYFPIWAKNGKIPFGLGLEGSVFIASNANNVLANGGYMLYIDHTDVQTYGKGADATRHEPDSTENVFIRVVPPDPAGSDLFGLAQVQ